MEGGSNPGRGEIPCIAKNSIKRIRVRAAGIGRAFPKT
jgi:hypothetical protein